MDDSAISAAQGGDAMGGDKNFSPEELEAPFVLRKKQPLLETWKNERAVHTYGKRYYVRKNQADSRRPRSGLGLRT